MTKNNNLPYVKITGGATQALGETGVVSVNFIDVLGKPVNLKKYD